MSRSESGALASCRERARNTSELSVCGALAMRAKRARLAAVQRAGRPAGWTGACAASKRHSKREQLIWCQRSAAAAHSNCMQSLIWRRRVTAASQPARPISLVGRGPSATGCCPHRVGNEATAAARTKRLDAGRPFFLLSLSPLWRVKSRGEEDGASRARAGAEEDGWAGELEALERRWLISMLLPLCCCCCCCKSWVERASERAAGRQKQLSCQRRRRLARLAQNIASAQVNGAVQPDC